MTLAFYGFDPLKVSVKSRMIIEILVNLAKMAIWVDANFERFKWIT